MIGEENENESENVRLVLAVQKHPVIYDSVTFPGNANKTEIEKAWMEVSKEINLNGTNFIKNEYNLRL